MTIDENKELIESVLKDAIAFGAAVGSWHESSIRWHQRAGGECINVIKSHAADYIISQQQDIRNKMCHVCGNKKPRQEP